MIQLVVGLLAEVEKFFGFSKVKEFTPVETLTPSKMGYYFEHEELKRLMDRLGNFTTVQFTDVRGNPLSKDSIDRRFGKDGGIDCVIHIVANSEHGCKVVAGKIRNILINGDY
ncbi:hypothetical protein [Nostoc sp. 'Peltigera malacea cyanobiont' DB3992]|uniref:hypothetical protein n=1 Tax=Nostoc sp. 'Peltigera malacea cyanobiont' DB3992 TaxID=1206980 RepID=UPI000C0511CA|nr:hypothetical protein [Nostoc sp. 'Peltigera malacea cyanobiont' DB3992]PHM07624.1 hypothetical protein CK516_25910 [Nostoc sp. 'Peltigera malacea cyanobiont' DB3992]